MPTDLETRIADLETHIAHQEKQIADLDTVVTRQSGEIEHLQRHLRALAGLVAELEEASEVPITKPPHY
ncbi:SlyX protein [Breoghania corrubedonensis]|uniref:Protein SlyX homolog n=1 Tax=Breoghania corrubedonensis TaxID=665038 RepID=A0A2T5VEY2_9HYPH|nr:SlyX family protein [Breoghania corrubedonensis]PTW62315.1 SlyX protein [Breoghania corrubedonensis]